MKRLPTVLALAAAAVSFELSAADGTINLTNYDSNNPIFQMPSFMSCIPEPSTFSLSLIAAAAFGLRRIRGIRGGRY